MIYFLRHIETGLIKIGFTSNFHQRLSRLTQKFGELELLALTAGELADESSLHKQFHHIRAASNSLEGVEWFQPLPELIDFIKNLKTIPIPAQDVMVTVQFGEDVREMLNILKKRYKMDKMSDALKVFLKEKDPELVQAGELLIRVQKRAVEDDSK